MSLLNIFNVAASGMTAQGVRLNTIASNLANVDSASGAEATTYRARAPHFSAIQKDMNALFSEGNVGVQVTDIIESQAPARKEFRPNSPIANSEGYVFLPNVNVVEEMTNMIASSRNYQTSVEVFNTAKQLMLQTLNIGR